MVRPSMRTRSRRKVKLTTPGGRAVTHFRRKKAGKATCGRCGRPLQGVASGSPTEIRGLSRSSRIPAKPYAGVLCPGCLDALLRYVTRMEVQHAVPEFSDLNLQRDLTLEKFLYRGWWADVTAGKVKRKAAVEKPWRKGRRVEAKGKPKARSRKKAE